MPDGDSKAKWTFMVYMAGFNNLSPFAGKDLEEMQTVGSTDDVKIVCFIKQLDKASAQHIVVGKGGRGEIREDVGKADSGKPQTLLDFVRWATKQAPAEKYALVVWNHGSGWQPDDLDNLYDQVRSSRGDTGVTPRELAVRSSQQISRSLFDSTVMEVLGQADARERAIASDDGTGHSLDTVELGHVLEKAQVGLKQPFELLGMDACLMSTLEVAYQARNDVKVVVGSEELEPGNGWPYERILKDLTANPAMSGEELGKLIVKHYIASYQDKTGEWPVTQCAVSAAGIPGFADALDALAGALATAAKDELGAAKVLRAQARSVTFTGDLVDLNTFCSGLASAGIDNSVTTAANKVIAALKPGDYVLGEGHLGPTVQGCGGVTAYFPTPGKPVSKYYAHLNFSRDHKWDDFLTGYHSAIRGD